MKNIPIAERARTLLDWLANKRLRVDADAREAVRGDVKVCFVELGESLHGGEHDPEDPHDVEVVRFDFYGRVNGRWLWVLDASYCTYVPASTPTGSRAELLVLLLAQGYRPVREGIRALNRQHHGAKRVPDSVLEFYPSSSDVFQALSWLNADGLPAPTPTGASLPPRPRERSDGRLLVHRGQRRAPLLLHQAADLQLPGQRARAAASG
jgi:hypothetical protein